MTTTQAPSPIHIERSNGQARAACSCSYTSRWSTVPTALNDAEAHDIAAHGLAPMPTRSPAQPVRCDSCERPVGAKNAAKYADEYQLDWALCGTCEKNA